MKNKQDIKQRVTHDFRRAGKAAGAAEKGDAGGRGTSGKSIGGSGSRTNKRGGGNNDGASRRGRSGNDTLAANEGASRRGRGGNDIAAANGGGSPVGAEKRKSATGTSRSRRRGGDALRIIPLGGLNEVGKNMTAFEYKDSIIIIDCGLSFPSDDMFGIDIVIPDFEYVERNRHKVKALVITHGHEDHIGGVPYLLKRIDVPVYATGLTLGLIGSKLQEHGIKARTKRIEAGQKLSIGEFKLEAIHMTHSIADALAFAIHTPFGTIFHSGDFKVDYTPVGNFPIDLHRLAEVGRKGVLLMLSDSTNANRKGYTKSEKYLSTIMENIFRDTDKRIIVATFASNIHRVQTIIDTAVKFKRKVALSGRSMDKILNIAIEMGYVSIPKGVLVDMNETHKIPDKKLVIVTTGSQGEPMSALARMAAGEHRQITIRKGDRIILSSTPIPGNEKTVGNIVNSLLAQGADVTYSDIAEIHVSGHACEEELKLLLSIIRPKYFMPVHGEVRHLNRHASIAEELGVPAKNIFILKNGNVLEVREGRIDVSQEEVDAEPVFVDGLGVGDISTIVLRDRKQLSESGLIIVVASLDPASGKVISGPDILSRGFTYVRENEELITELRDIAAAKLVELNRSGTRGYAALKKEITTELKRYIQRKTGRSPVILPVFMDA